MASIPGLNNLSIILKNFTPHGVKLICGTDLAFYEGP